MFIINFLRLIPATIREAMEMRREMLQRYPHLRME